MGKWKWNLNLYKTTVEISQNITHSVCSWSEHIMWCSEGYLCCRTGRCHIRITWNACFLRFRYNYEAVINTSLSSFDDCKVISWYHWVSRLSSGTSVLTALNYSWKNPSIFLHLTIPFYKQSLESFPVMKPYDTWMKRLKIHDKGFRVLYFLPWWLPNYLWGMA